MLNIGQQLRLGRYPGFEEGALSSSPVVMRIRTSDFIACKVWPAIIQNLITDDKKGENSEGSKS